MLSYTIAGAQYRKGYDMSKRDAIDGIGAARQALAQWRKTEEEAKAQLGELHAGQRIIGNLYVGLVKEQERSNLSLERLKEVLGEKEALRLVEACGKKPCLVLQVQERETALANLAAAH